MKLFKLKIEGFCNYTFNNKKETLKHVTQNVINNKKCIPKKI